MIKLLPFKYDVIVYAVGMESSAANVRQRMRIGHGGGVDVFLYFVSHEASRYGYKYKY